MIRFHIIKAPIDQFKRKPCRLASPAPESGGADFLISSLLFASSARASFFVLNQPLVCLVPFRVKSYRMVCSMTRKG
ncbi:MAG: hypothetical protein VR64_15185 [Desulfatitalea sp. BRH_c12]|nr:MAG: hypothetical protein VR64_15185 [Desulfatitalea sp. BRH_c12]